VVKEEPSDTSELNTSDMSTDEDDEDLVTGASVSAEAQGAEKRIKLDTDVKVVEKGTEIDVKVKNAKDIPVIQKIEKPPAQHIPAIHIPVNRTEEIEVCMIESYIGLLSFLIFKNFSEMFLRVV